LIHRRPLRHPSGKDKQILASLEHGLLLGEGFISIHILDADERRVTQINTEKSAFIRENLRPVELACPEHQMVRADGSPVFQLQLAVWL
jgi:hypothetical protein